MYFDESKFPGRECGQIGLLFTAQNGTLSVSTFVKSFLGLVEFEKLQRKDIKMFTDIFIKEMTFLSKFSQLASSLRVDSAKVGL